MLFPILTIVGGLIAASSFIVARKPNAREVFDKIAPYQGVLGIGLFAVGVWWSLRVIPHLGAITTVPLTMSITIAAILLDLSIGFLLGYGLLNKWLLSKNVTAQARGKEVLAKLARIQVPLGIAATAMGTVALIGV